MRKGLLTKIVRSVADLLTEVEPSWTRAGTSVARRTGPWVQVIEIDTSRWSDEFVPRFGMTYLRAWDEIPYVGATLTGRRLHTERTRVDDWITEQRFLSNPNSVIELLRAQVLPRIDEPLRDVVAERLVREYGADWPTHHTLCFVAAERLDRPEAQRHLYDLERLTKDRPLEDWVESARTVVAMIDRPDDLRAHLNAIQEAKLASIKGRPLG